MKRVVVVLFVLSFCALAIAQSSKERLDDLGRDVKIYGNAASKMRSREYQQGIDIIVPLIDKACKTEGYDRQALASYYNLAGQLHRCVRRYAEAEQFHKNAIKTLEAAGDNGKKEINDTWYQLSLVYYYWGGHNRETLNAADRCVEAAVGYYGEYHSESIEAYSLRANYNGMYGNERQALEDKQRVFDIISHNMERNFAFLTESERAAYWNKYRMETQDMLGFARNFKLREGEFIDYVYDQQLLSKGILLSAESALQRAIEEDASLAATYNKIRGLRKRAMETSVTPQDAEKATLEADRLERELTSKANGVSEFLNFMKIRTRDVKERLHNGEVAIEFGECPKGKDSVMYSAIILCPEWEHAHFVWLCEARDIVRDRENLTNLIWNPILRELGGRSVTKIYFAPTGLLYQLPIESHRMSDGQIVGEKYKMYRMSSTRWLAAGDNSVDGQGTVLYGDLQYDASIKYLAEDMKRYPKSKVRSAGVDFGKSRGTVSELEPLPATKREIESIAGIVRNDVRTKRGKEGTEASFKALSGQKKRIIHVATHGFYSEGKDKEVLNNSGLFFAGANNAYMGERLPDGVEDGVLTAKEVADLNFTGLDLLVLSACETGLGSVAADGVFGLQRGFKKAGAKSILMSLWKVDDAATCKLMTEFYANWLLRNMTKHDALEVAKKSVRETKGWENPMYWAAFILLDVVE